MWKEVKATFGNWSQEDLDNLKLKDFNHMTVWDFVEGTNLKEVPNATYTETSKPLPTSDTTINIYAGTNENADLSNFAIRPFTHHFYDGGVREFQSVEQAFQYIKD